MENNNPYKTPQSPQSETALSGLEDWEKASLLNEFIFQNTAYYEKYYPDFFSGKYSLGFNWAATFFTVPWLAYRKMYFWLFAYLFLTFLLTVAVVAVAAKFLGMSQVNAIYLNYSLLFVMKIYMGFNANRIYLSRATKKVGEITDATADPEDRSNRLSLTGGTSSLACTLVILLNFAFSLLMHRM